MENNNIRTMEFLGNDDWSRPVYKCIETNCLYKDITLGSKNPELYSCSNDFDGEPDSHIKYELEIHYIEREPQPTEEEKFNYMLLSRLESDCKYYLGYGYRNANKLWAGNEMGQIEKMKELYNCFSKDKKPEWLTYEQILEYEKLMIIEK
jgi:hypothetical protein